MLELLNVLGRGSDYDAALKKVYGFDMDELDAMWRAYVTGQDHNLAVVTTAISIRDIPKPIIVVMAVLATAVVLMALLVVERWAWRKR